MTSVQTSELRFEQVLTDRSGGNVKTPQCAFKVEGKYPIVDQGKALGACRA